jgi:capsular exopolysaccharide synthesis family protein
MALRYHVHVLRRRWWLVALVALTVVAGAWWRSRGQVSQYTAEMRIQRTPDRGLLDAGWAGFYDLTPEAISGQIQVIQGQTVLEPVADSVGARLVMVDPAEVRSQVFNEIRVTPDAPVGTYSIRVQGAEHQLLDSRNNVIARTPRGSLLIGRGFMVGPRASYNFTEPVAFQVIAQDEAIEAIKAGLRVEQMKGSMILAIRFTSSDPEYSADVADQVGHSYIWYAGSRTRRDATRRKEILADRLAQLSDSLLRARMEVHSIDRVAGMAGSAPTQAAAGDAMVSATTRLRDAQFTRSQLISLREALRRPGTEGVQRALALAQIMPGVGSYHDRMIQLQTQRMQAVQSEGLAANSRKVMALDSAIESSRADILALTEAQIQSSDALVANAEDRLRELQGEYGAVSSRQAATDAKRQQVEAIERVYTDLSEKYYEATINERLESGSVDVISNATTPKTPDGSRKTRSFLFALIVGLMLGVLAAFVLEQMDTRVRDAEDAQRAAAVGVIGMIPELRGDASRPLTLKADDHTLGAEAYRKLRTNLRFLRADRARVIGVTSPSPDEGKSVTAANLALAIAQQGQEVLIIDGDLRRPVQHEIFGVERGPGLSDALVGLIDPFDALQVYHDLPNVSVLACGTEAPNPAELLGSDAFSRLLDTLIERFDTIIIDTPPVNLVTDAAVIGSVTDGVLLVAEAGRTDRSVLAAAVNELRSARGSVLGIVLNRVTAGGRYGHSGYYSGKAYYRRDSEPAGGNGDRVQKVKDWVSTLV